MLNFGDASLKAHDEVLWVHPALGGRCVSLVVARVLSFYCALVGDNSRQRLVIFLSWIRLERYVPQGLKPGSFCEINVRAEARTLQTAG